MKKIVGLLLLVLVLAGCEMYKTKDVLIDNKSNEPATLAIKNIKEGDKKLLGTSITVNSGEAISLPFYSDGEVSLQSVGRNFLKKISDTHYRILDLQPITFTIYNTTDKKVKLLEVYNLFDIQTLNPNETKNNVQVFNPEKIQPLAVSDPEKIKLRASVQEKKIIIAY